MCTYLFGLFMYLHSRLLKPNKGSAQKLKLYYSLNALAYEEECNTESFLIVCRLLVIITG